MDIGLRVYVDDDDDDKPVVSLLHNDIIIIVQLKLPVADCCFFCLYNAMQWNEYHGSRPRASISSSF